MTDNERTRHSTTQTFGLALISAAGLVISLVTIVFFDGAFVVFYLVPTAVALGAVYVTWRFDRQWARALGLVASLLAAFAMFFIAFGIFAVFSPLEFVIAWTFVLGFFVSLVAGIQALVAGRRGKTVADQGLGRFRVGVLSVIGVAAVVSLTGFLVTRQTVSEAEAGGATVLDMVGVEFVPGSSTVPVGGKLLIQNSDPILHDFVLDDLDIAINIWPASEALVELDGLPSGTYDYFCSLHTDGETGMIGTITVTG